MVAGFVLYGSGPCSVWGRGFTQDWVVGRDCLNTSEALAKREKRTAFPRLIC